MHVKPPARAHTVTPHCGSHCHQLHVYLTLQFLCARAPGHVAGSDAHRHGAVREPAALLLRRGHTRAAQGAQILKHKLSRSNPIIAFLLSVVRIAQPDRGARNQRRRPFPRSCTMIFVAMLRILRARGGDHEGAGGRSPRAHHHAQRFCRGPWCDEGTASRDISLARQFYA